MAIKTLVERINLTATPDLKQEIIDTCDIMAARTPPFRLSASFESNSQLILVFQSTT